MYVICRVAKFCLWSYKMNTAEIVISHLHHSEYNFMFLDLSSLELLNPILFVHYEKILLEICTFFQVDNLVRLG